MHERAKRSTVQGWTKETVRRHTKWLYAINTDGLSGYGYAPTLTMRHCPESATDFHALRRSWIRRIERMGATRLHWVIEWQRRGVPHVHAAVYFDRELDAADKSRIVSHWLDVAAPYGVRWESQHLAAIDGPSGWLQYLSKHAARGAAHYQRQGKPAGWEKTGRLWGHTGPWPVDEPMRFDVPREAYFRYRRLVRAWRIADARAEEDAATRARRIRSARGMLRCHDRQLSEVRGISEWISQDQLIRYLGLLAAEGFDVRQTDG
jgi:hypothetical protein